MDKPTVVRLKNSIEAGVGIGIGLTIWSVVLAALAGAIFLAFAGSLVESRAFFGG